MSRGRKKVVPSNSDWESVFYNSVGTYVQYINLKLAEHIKAEPLSNHIRIAGGYAFKSSEYKKQGVPVIRISDFSNEKIVLDDVVYYDESKDLKRYELNEGDIVIALTGGTIAKLGIVQKGIGKLYLNQRVGKFEVLHPEEFETEYVYWIARSVQSIIKNLAWGAAIPNVSPKHIEELQFPIPDKETQNGIIDFLNDLRANKVDDDKEYFNSEVEDYVFSMQANQIRGSELQSELINQQGLVKQLREAFLQEAMQGKLTKQSKQDGSARELLEKIKKEKEKLIAEKIIRKEKGLPPIKVEEIPFDIPENWKWCRLYEICLKITDGTHHSPHNYEKGDFKYVTAKNIKDDGIDLSKITYVSDEVHREIFARCNPEKGDILYIKDGATTGIVTINNLEEPFSMLSSVALLKPSFYIDNKFLMYALRSPFYYKATRKDMSGVAITRVTLEKIQRALIPVPPIQEQNRIVIKLEELMNLCDELFESINQSKIEIERLIKTLLNDALGVTTTYDIAKDKTLKQEIRKLQTTDNTFERISMKIIEILQASNKPVSATIVWNSCEYNKDIEAFYAELKRLIDIEKLVVEEKQGKESFLKLAANEN
jgi:type I restriction enzyme S subunit